MLFFDPQTSGGLLLAVPQGNTSIFEAEMRRLGGAFWQVGRVAEGEGIRFI
jgi:selenide,water dikinase